MGQILPKTTPEQRLRFYDDVETLVTTGFLSVSFTINGTSLALRSLGPGDSFLLRARVVNDQAYEWKVWSIASSLWLVDGYNLLDESNVTPRLAKMVKSLPATAQDILFELALGLYDRQGKALEATEAYCYENLSRYRWKTFGGHFPSAHAGIPGAERLGTNQVQRLWTFFNEVEDTRLQEATQWEGFKLTASAQAPKGVKKIDERDRTSRQAELDRRQTLQDKFFYTRLGIISEDPTQKEQPLMVVGMSKSADELADEMYRWVTGQEDQHDRTVAAYKRHITEKFEQEQRERAERAAVLRAAQEIESDRPRALVGYTPGQLENILKGRQLGHPGVRSVSEGEGLLQERLYQSHLKGDLNPGALQAVEGRLEVREGADLTQQVNQRRVLFGAGPADADAGQQQSETE